MAVESGKASSSDSLRLTAGKGVEAAPNEAMEDEPQDTLGISGWVMNQQGEPVPDIRIDALLKRTFSEGADDPSLRIAFTKARQYRFGGPAVVVEIVQMVALEHQRFVEVALVACR